jgi:hypothetical protein
MNPLDPNNTSYFPKPGSKRTERQGRDDYSEVFQRCTKNTRWDEEEGLAPMEDDEALACVVTMMEDVSILPCHMRSVCDVIVLPAAQISQTKLLKLFPRAYVNLLSPTALALLTMAWQHVLRAALIYR